MKPPIYILGMLFMFLMNIIASFIDSSPIVDHLHGALGWGIAMVYFLVSFEKR